MTFWVAACLAAVFVGMSKGGLPVIGMLSVPVMSLVIPPLTAAGLLLPVYVVSDMFGLVAYRRDFNGRVLVLMMVAMTIGVGIGWATAHLVPESWVTVLVGVIGTAFALNFILRRGQSAEARQMRVAPGLFWGTISGFTSFVSHSGGPPFQMYVLPLKLSKTVFVGTTTIAFAYVNTLKLIPYYALGQLSLDNLHIAAVLAVPAGLAVFAGVRLVKVLPEALFFKVVIWALLAVSLKLIWDGLV
ncbi:sulfite exporter TauE/SafE family protein [Limimaricola sp.]|uniref:sulfite exporter TauE/SafE family protein n=1 Tax=Limimaricola sp. TaxID=2211665 RepID=UPI0025BE06B6|nr:sulfite exporter TauE/SafE family protein [Limimaricola sp.]